MADTAGHIKSDPDLSPSPMLEDEDDAFEDTGELEMPKSLPQAWMIKVPKLIYDRWSEIEDDEPIRIGTLKRFQGGRTQVMLDSTGQATKYNKQIPLEYEMREGTNHGNTFMFSEKDLPGSRRRYRRDLGPQSGVSKKERYRPWRSRTVPKQTKLAAAAAHEAQWFPVENAQYYAVMPKSILSDRKGENEMKMLQGDAVDFSGTLLRNGRKKQDGGFNKFVGAAPISKAQKKKEKAIRIPEDQMLDLLADAFQQYDYYHVSTLRARIRQPETYIRQMLNQIATFISTGDHAGTYKLNDDMRRTKGSSAHGGATAPEMKAEDLPSEVDAGTDDDNLEMEDVKP